MTYSEKTGLLSGEELRVSEVTKKKYRPAGSKFAVSCFGVLAVAGICLTVFMTTGNTIENPATTSYSGNIFLASSNSQKATNSEDSSPVRCTLSQDQLNEIANYQGTVNKIIDYVLNGAGKSMTYNKLATFVDKFGPRLSGTKALEDSIDYMLKALNEDGLENVHGENVMVPRWVRGNESAEMLQPRHQKLFMLGLGDSVPTPPEGIVAEIIVVKTFQELSDMDKAKVEGKIVVFNQAYEKYEKSTSYRRRGAVEAAKKGAVATLIRSVTDYSLSTPHTGWQDYNPDVKKIPTACITVENADMLDRLTKQGVKVVVRLKMGCRRYPDVNSRNVVAEIKGSKYPEQVVIVSGHIDSWDVGQGAQDDGGGAFISTEALSIVHALGLKPKRTLRAVLWTSEEPGVIGAHQYARDHKNETKNWSLIMESDMGTFKPQGLIFSGQNDQAKCIMGEIVKFLNPIESGKLFLSHESGPDIRQWTSTGIPGAILSSANEKYFHYHHTDADTMTYVDSQELDLCSILWAVSSYIVADLEKMLLR